MASRLSDGYEQTQINLALMQIVSLQVAVPLVDIGPLFYDTLRAADEFFTSLGYLEGAPTLEQFRRWVEE